MDSSGHGSNSLPDESFDFNFDISLFAPPVDPGLVSLSTGGNVFYDKLIKKSSVTEEPKSNSKFMFDFLDPNTVF